MTETKAESMAEPGIVPEAKSKVIPMARVSAVTKYEVKAGPGSEANIRYFAKAIIESRPQRKREDGIKVRAGAGDRAGIIIESSDEDEENVCSWFWTGEEPSVGSWFWPEEETPSQVYKPPPKIQEKPKPIPKPELTIKQKAAAWSRARYSVLVPIEGGEQSLPPGNWTLVETLIETPLGIRPLTKIPPYDGPYFQTLAEIKNQVRYREKYGPNPRACRCKSRNFSLEPKEFDKLVALLKLTKDPFIHEIATMIMGISPAYPFTQDIIHDVGITVMIENLVNNPNVTEHPRALNMVDDNSESSEEPQPAESYIHQVCKDIISCPLNSPVQLAGLKLLVNLSVKFEDHRIIANYIPDFLTLLNKGSVKTKFYVLKVFLRLSKNQANTRELISAKVLSSLVAPFNKNESKANILNIIEIFENINFQFKKKAKLFTKEEFTKSELISIFQEAKEFGQKLQDLADHSDPETWKVGIQKGSHWSETKVMVRLHFSEGSWGESASLPIPASGSCLHSLGPGFVSSSKPAMAYPVFLMLLHCDTDSSAYFFHI
ncbi:armadillo repeat-containing X-linked protein 5 isoform X1 [Ailuropoda melanoleuca]|uniref:armadillo repeat-containing X-linked protein 5 isoform X1 n=1 Tax=Ailuropoda melanoleuca TaxID=9646 RepID=UPI001494D1E2|nr:armadillo repeat-containing X-linked protein 5 isoform X1 [Ailuropoda melanoleuca]XP_034509460.1 armadillo repeat-containing X-linked protein 5 isoform X1 [Ailuropoda melanoleuca]